MFCWETLGPVNAKLTHSTHPNTVADQVQSHIAMALPAGPQTAQEWL